MGQNKHLGVCKGLDAFKKREIKSEAKQAGKSGEEEKREGSSKFQQQLEAQQGQQPDRELQRHLQVNDKAVGEWLKEQISKNTVFRESSFGVESRSKIAVAPKMATPKLKEQKVLKWKKEEAETCKTDSNEKIERKNPIRKRRQIPLYRN